MNDKTLVKLQIKIHHWLWYLDIKDKLVNRDSGVTLGMLAKGGNA